MRSESGGMEPTRSVGPSSDSIEAIEAIGASSFIAAGGGGRRPMRTAVGAEDGGTDGGSGASTGIGGGIADARVERCGGDGTGSFGLATTGGWASGAAGAGSAGGATDAARAAGAGDAGRATGGSGTAAVSSDPMSRMGAGAGTAARSAACMARADGQRRAFSSASALSTTAITGRGRSLNAADASERGWREAAATRSAVIVSHG